MRGGRRRRRRGGRWRRPARLGQLERREADPHRVAQLERRRLAHPHAVHERPVRGAEILDRQPPAGVAVQARVAARQLRVVAETALSALRPPDHELVVEREPAARLRTQRDHELSRRRRRRSRRRGAEAGRLRDAPLAVGHLQLGLPHPHDVAQAERSNLLDPLAVHERPVRRAEVLDRQLARGAARGARVTRVRSRGRRPASPAPRRRSDRSAGRPRLPGWRRVRCPRSREAARRPSERSFRLTSVRACPSCGEETPERARFCPVCGMALGGVPAPQGLRKVVTIVFCDLCDSTKLGERLDPEALRQVIARYFGR